MEKSERQATIDGYKMRKTVDGTYVFVEGKSRTPYDLTREEMARFRACLKRRGIPDFRY